MCCSYCVFKSMHLNHKILELTEESLKNENIEYEEYTKEFNSNLDNIISLKDKIEKEIIKINNSYDKINIELKNIYKEKYDTLILSYNQKKEKLTKAYENDCRLNKENYEKKYEKLINEENNIKETLENKVTEIKQNLENNLYKINNLIKSNEIINKGIKKSEKNKNENNILKNLTYISTINKNKKEITSFPKELMTSSEIYFEKNKLKFDEYYFNGFPCPKNIKLDYYTNLKIKWDFDEIDLIDMKKNKIKFLVEIKKENEDYLKKYEGNKRFCTIENLDNNSKYEIRINSLYNNIICSFNTIQTNTLKYYISKILCNSESTFDYLNQILDWTECKNLKLLYRGSKDGFTKNIFHEKCNNKGPTVTLIQNKRGDIFGGFTSISWSNKEEEILDKDSFIFSLSNIYNSKPIKFNIEGKGANIHHSSTEGPNFGFKYQIFDFEQKYDMVLLSNSGYSQFPIYFKDDLGKGNSIFTGTLDLTKKFEIKEIEIFNVFK